MQNEVKAYRVWVSRQAFGGTPNMACFTLLYLIIKFIKTICEFNL